jgi:hypothetical protein
LFNDGNVEIKFEQIELFITISVKPVHPEKEVELMLVILEPIVRVVKLVKFKHELAAIVPL